MNFWTNVLRLQEQRGKSLRSLAAEVGVTPGALSNYSRGSVPGLDIAIRIAEALGVSMDALIWGKGDATEPPRCRAPEEHDMLRELVKELEAEEILLLSTLSTQYPEWHIADALNAAYPEALSLDELRQALGSPPEEVFQASLLTLKRRKIVREERSETGPRVRLASPVVLLSAKEQGNRTQHVKRAVRVLFGKVLPRLLEHDKCAHLTTVVASVPRSTAERMSSELHAFIKQRSAEIVCENGSANIAVVFAVAVEEEHG